MRWLPTFVRSFVVSGLMGLPATAFALNCEEVMNMVTLNIPADIVADTVRNAGSLSAADVQCLESRNAPAAVLEAARRKANASTAASRPAPQPSSAPAELDEEDEEEQLSDEIIDFSKIGTDADEPEPDEGDRPPAIEEAIEAYRANKPATAAQELHRLLRDGIFPKHETTLLYYLGKSLFDLEMYHSAQHYFFEVVRKGPSNPYFKYALPRLDAIANLTGNNYELLRVVAKIPPEAFPRQARNRLYYLLGRRHYISDDLSGALEHFGQVSEKSPLYLRAKYHEGVINQERGKLRSSVMAFREVISTNPDSLGGDRALREVEDLKDLAYINIARIYFGLERFENADTYYSMVERDSSYWPTSLFERAWTNFWKADLNHTLGLLLTVDSPYFSKREFIPEVTILRALTFFNFCEYSEVERLLREFERDHKPMQAELEAFLEKYGKERTIWDQAYESYFEAEHEESALSQALFGRVLRNRQLAALVNHLEMMDEEIAGIELRPTAFRNGIGESLRTMIEEDRQRYKKQAGRELLRELSAQNDALSGLLVQSEIIRFEVVDAQRSEYEFRAQNINELQAGDQQRIDFAVNRDIIYWPFNGEFWRDELGYYRYTENSACQ